jgi:hypothetical protein
MRSAYRGLAHLIAFGVVVQAASVAYAWFDVLAALEAGTVFDANSEPNAGHLLHGMLGMYAMPLFGLAFLVAAFFAKVPGGARWAAVVLALSVLQVALGLLAFGAPALGALHGVNAIVLLGCAVHAAQRSRERADVGLPATRVDAAR